MSVTISATMQQFFFDREKVIARIGKINARRLSRAGAYIRTTAKQKVLRRRNRVSLPGQPPSVHSQDSTATLKNIQFAMNPVDESVIVGPVKLNTRERSAGGELTTVPERLEKGGIGIIEEERWLGSTVWRRRDQRRNSSDKKTYRKRRAVYRPRPFMSVALSMEAKKGTIIGLFGGVQ